MEVVKMGSPQDQKPNMEALFKYLPQSLETLLSSPEGGAAMYKIWDARNLVLDREKYFKR
jgi:hypothetical protein